MYYRGENLIGVSQIIYRIKGNSNLLATIAVINNHKENKVTYKRDIVMINGSGLTQKYKGPFEKDLKAPFIC